MFDPDEFMQLAIADPFSASPGDGREELTFREGQKQHLGQGTLSLGPSIRRPPKSVARVLVDLRTEHIDKDFLSIGCLLVSSFSQSAWTLHPSASLAPGGGKGWSMPGKITRLYFESR